MIWFPFLKGFDKDRDVKLNRMEIKEVCYKIKGYTSDAEIDQLIRKYDITGDGKVRISISLHFTN